MKVVVRIIAYWQFAGIENKRRGKNSSKQKNSKARSAPGPEIEKNKKDGKDIKRFGRAVKGALM